MKQFFKRKLFYFHQIRLKLLNRSKSQIFRGFSNLVSYRVAQSVNLLLNQKGQQVLSPDLNNRHCRPDSVSANLELLHFREIGADVVRVLGTMNRAGPLVCEFLDFGIGVLC